MRKIATYSEDNAGIYTGRHRIFTDVEEFTDENIADVISSANSVHHRNKLEINFLHKYLKGRQPILDRTKEVRPEINNKPVENHALEIQNFKVGFTFGEPVQYVLHGELKDEGADTAVTKFNELMSQDDKPAKDKQLADWIFQCGVGYRMILPANPFETYIVDPRQAFVVLSDDYKRQPVLCAYTNHKGDKINVYSKNHFWIIESGKIIESAVNPLGELPIIQYQNNSNLQGCYEIVLDLCNALNNIQANRLDGVEQFIQSFIWFNNCDIDEESFTKLKENGGIKTKSPAGMQASIKILSESLDQQQTQQLTDDIYQKMLTIAGVPDRKASAGGNTGQALIIGEGWVMAESSAKDFELDFSKPEKQFIKVALKIASTTYPELRSLSVSSVDIKFTRNKTDNLLTKAQALMNMLQTGVHPRLAFKICGLFNDPEQAYQDSIPYIDKIIYGTSEDLQQTTTDNPVTSELLKVMTGIKGNLDNEPPTA